MFIYSLKEGTKETRQRRNIEITPNVTNQQIGSNKHRDLPQQHHRDRVIHSGGHNGFKTSLLHLNQIVLRCKMYNRVSGWLRRPALKDTKESVCDY